eukprot:36468-Eustigmatos_ZCMA.PRE.1
MYNCATSQSVVMAMSILKTYPIPTHPSFSARASPSSRKPSPCHPQLHIEHIHATSVVETS